MSRLTTAQRKRLSRSTFAIPERRAYPINDAIHARNALSRVAANGTPSEKRRVRSAVARKFPGVNQSNPGAKRPTRRAPARKSRSR